jgi:hypothetical protein
MPRDAADLARLLAGQVGPLAAELLPNGRRDGQEWRVGSLAGERGQSLAVHLSGARAGVWSDFSSGERGDALDLVAAVLYRDDKALAMAWARSWLGLGDGAAPAAQRRAPPAAPAAERDPEAEARRGAARRLFLSAVPSLASTPVAHYLAGRGIDLAELARQSRALRFHPALQNRESGRAWPALVAAVTNAAGEMIAVHRTWLAQDDAGQWRKAPLRDPKMSLGSVSGGTIRLWRGASGKPLAQAPDGDETLIAEGIETALSCAIACPELRVLAAVSLGNLVKVVLPPAVRSVIIAADNDTDNPQAAEAVQRAVDRFIAEGRSVRIARSPIGKDFNDCLVADGIA